MRCRDVRFYMYELVVRAYSWCGSNQVGAQLTNKDGVLYKVRRDISQTAGVLNMNAQI